MERIGQLMDAAPAPGSPESDELEVLSVLVSDYEERNALPSVADPVAAIEFRMDQLGLSPRDLIPYLGSRSRVSEVLGRKRNLSMSMIRALHDGLGIPLASLVGKESERDSEIPWERFPLREMIARGWVTFDKPVRANAFAPSAARDLLQEFFAPLGGVRAGAALYRRTAHVRSARQMDPYALAAWTARVLIRARHITAEYRAPIAEDSVRRLVRLSILDDGPRQAVEYLRECGVVVIVEPHLPKTYVDGAALLDDDGRPVIGLTLRYDRLDNFWFTLLHEVAHLRLHILKGLVTASTAFYDDLDVSTEVDSTEAEADKLAGDSLIPPQLWEVSAAKFVKSPEAATQLAQAAGVHVAVAAGRVRNEFRDYRVLSGLIGHGEVRRWFPEAFATDK